MPRRERVASGGIVYHVLNRRVGRLPLFEAEADFAAFETVLAEAQERTGVRLCAYCVMPNHWHLLWWPRADGELSEVMRWLTVTHTQRWHAHHGSAGSGPVYQGRFKSFPVQNDAHILAAARYVERNALRANLVECAEDWRWSSLWRRTSGSKRQRELLSEWPVARPRNWRAVVNKPQSEEELEVLRRSVNRGQPFGQDRWQARMAKRLKLESTLRPRGRPKKS